MDAVELLAREDEFKRLNKQLEKKTESLLREIEHVMHKQDFFHHQLSPIQNKIKKHCCTPSPESTTPTRQPTTPIRQSTSPIRQPTTPVRQQTMPVRQHTTPVRRPIRKSYESQSKSNSEFEIQTQNKTQKRVNCDCCPIKERSDEMEFLYAFVSVNVKDKVLPPSFSKDRVSVESVCKFLSSKIKLMQEQIDKLQSTIERKASQCEGHLTQLAEFESERLTLLNRTNNMKCSTADMKAKYMALQKRLEEKERQYKEQRSEADRLSSELKKVMSKNVTFEAKCSSQEHVIETLRQQLEICKRSEKEFRESSRSLSATHQSAISRLESRTKALAARLEKLTALVDNLRKQNLLLATDGAVKCLERDYCNFLNQD